MAACAATATCKRVMKLGIGSTGIKLFDHHRLDSRSISQLAKANGKRLFLVDTLALVRRLEAQGVPSKQAEAITGAMIEVLSDSLDNASHWFVSKDEMQKNEMTLESYARGNSILPPMPLPLEFFHIHFRRSNPST